MESFFELIVQISFWAVCLMIYGTIHTVFVSYASQKFGGTGVVTSVTSNVTGASRVYFYYRVWLLALVVSILFSSFIDVYLIRNACS